VVKLLINDFIHYAIYLLVNGYPEFLFGGRILTCCQGVNFIYRQAHSEFGRPKGRERLQYNIVHLQTKSKFSYEHEI
jgi:hypothetical protein